MNKQYFAMRSRYEFKRHFKSYVRRKKAAKRNRINFSNAKKDKLEFKDFVKKSAPKNFSFIDNTNEVLEYFDNCKKGFEKKEMIYFDIAKLSILTADAITLLIALVNDESFTGKRNHFYGNVPIQKKLKKLLSESGFYNFVGCSKRMKNMSNSSNNLLHKEFHTKVKPEIARKACQFGIKHVFKKELILSSLYEVLIESMSNTNNHASEKSEEHCKWWLSVYNIPDGRTIYSFLDLGIGIFDSVPVSRFKKLKIWSTLMSNIELVPSLLDGQIKSSKKLDNNIRGKGLPQIAQNSNDDCIKRAYIISNDVKINLKDRSSEQLNYSFNGTFLYWELFDPDKK